MRDHFGNMCERVGQGACAGGMMMCVCICVAVDLYRSLISEHESNATVRREQKTERGRECKIVAE